jgi:hypothetical protein
VSAQSDGSFLAHRLQGQGIFLSASVPNRREVETRLYRGPLPSDDQIRDQDLRIETAVTALARAVFCSGGQIVFGGHPAISPHVAMVAAEYFPPSIPGGEKSDDADRPYTQPIIVFQSEAFKDAIVEDVKVMERLGQAKICWTESVDGERFEPALAGVKQCPKSLQLMRRRMVACRNLVAMVCIGGMDGIFDEYEVYAESSRFRPPYVLTSTGGASAILATLGRLGVHVKAIDLSLSGADAARVVGAFPPYDAIVQEIIDELAPDDGSWPLPPPQDPSL